jgi:transposase
VRDPSRQRCARSSLDPKVRQSGSEPARTGRISKQGSPQARWALVEATHSVVRQPGPLRAFHHRVRARRGYNIATVAAARKLACLFWCLLTRDEHYAHAQPSLTAKKLRKLELIAGAKRRDPSAAGIHATYEAMRQAERQLAEQAEASYTRMVGDWQAAAPRKAGASATPERAYRKALEGQAARQTQSS